MVFEPITKQKVALYYLTQHNSVKFIGYGGSAGSGKSYIGSFWIFQACINNPGAVFVIGRRSLTNLKKTTFLSFLKVISSKKEGLGLNPEDYFNINHQTNTINFKNGSKIFLMDMAHQPSDPEYLRFGGLELDGAFIDESNECDRKALDIISSRIGRGITNLPTKMLETFNPSKNHVYSRFYQPWKLKTFDKHTVFIPALPTDNHHLTTEYLDMLRTLPEVQQQRLLHGNFDYDDDDRALCQYDKLLDCFSNDFLKQDYKDAKGYIVSDLAMQGRDKFIVTYWKGFHCKIEIVKGKSTGKEIEEDLRKTMMKYKVPRSYTLADSDGMGNYISSYIEGIKEFHGGSSANNKEEFKNLKSECAFKLAELINDGKIFIECSDDVKQEILLELGQLKRDNLDKDEMKKHLIKKDEMKENIGRSPDFLDCLIMRMFWEVKPQIICV